MEYLLFNETTNLTGDTGCALYDPCPKNCIRSCVENYVCNINKTI